MGNALAASRRGLLTGATALATSAAAAVTVAAPAQAPVPADLHVELYRRFCAFDAEADRINDAATALRCVLTARHGNPTSERPANVVWSGDPDLARLRTLNREADHMTDLAGSAAQAMVDLPATSVPGVLAKVRLALGYLSFNREEDLGHQDMAILTALRDVERLLARGVA